MLTFARSTLSRAVLVLLVALAPLSRAFASERDHDRWYVIEMMGQRAGYLHDTGRTDGDLYTGRSAMTISIKRGAAPIEITMSSEFVETLDGKPVSMSSTQKMGARPTTRSYVFGPEDVEVTETQGKQKKTTTRRLPDGEWLTPRAAAEFVERRLAADAREIAVRSIDPATGLTPGVTTRTVKEKTTIDALGKTVPAVKWVAVSDRFPGVESVEYVDERGVPIRTETKFGGIGMVMVLADKELALSDLDPPELMMKTLVIPDRPIEDPRRVRTGSFLLSSKGDALGDLPGTAVQTVERVDARTLRVGVRLDGQAGGDAAADADNAEYRAPSAMVGSDDKAVLELVDRAIGKSDKPVADKAESLRRFVARHIGKKTLGVGFATASETARTGTGDCSEHATLLAAMLRAAGIPSRAVSGLVYADHFAGADAIFGYHMWTQALLESDGKPTWVDLDATLGPDTPFDATHIALATSSLSDDDTTNAMVALAPLIGTLEIKVEKAE